MTQQNEPEPRQPSPPIAQPQPMSDVDRKNWAMAAHFSALVAFVGVPSLIGPLVVWLMKKDQDEYVAAHAVHALNFNISVLLYLTAASIILVIVGIATLGLGFLAFIPLAIVAFIGWLVYVIQAGMAASRGEQYRYPLTIDFVK